MQIYTSARILRMVNKIKPTLMVSGAPNNLTFLLWRLSSFFAIIFCAFVAGLYNV